MSRYELWLTSSTGKRIQPIPFDRLEYAKSVNGAGHLVVTCRKHALDARVLTRDMRFEVWRESSQGRHYLDMETPWFLEEIQETYGPHAAYTLGATSATGLLARRIVAYSSGTAQALKSGAIDSIMTTIVQENFGASATNTARRCDPALFSVLPSALDAIPSVTDYDGSQKNTLTLLQDLANMSAGDSTTPVPLYFDIVAVQNMLSFRVFAFRRGTDRTGHGVLFSPELKTLSDVTATIRYSDEITDMYVLGQGQSDEQLIGKATDLLRSLATPWSRREAIESGKAQTQGGLDAEARSYLRRATPRIIVAGSIQDTPRVSYGDTWELGDTALAQIGTTPFTATIQAVSVTVENQTARVSAKIQNV